jgi:hypothetical protein
VLQVFVANVLLNTSNVSAVDYCTVRVHVENANDNAPIIHRCPRTVRIAENLPSTIVTLLDATDIDRDTHLTYSIVRGNTSAFGIDAHTGELYTLVSLDRETIDAYELLVQVTDTGGCVYVSIYHFFSPPSPLDRVYGVCVGDGRE